MNIGFLHGGNAAVSMISGGVDVGINAESSNA